MKNNKPIFAIPLISCLLLFSLGFSIISIYPTYQRLNISDYAPSSVNLSINNLDTEAALVTISFGGNASQFVFSNSLRESVAPRSVFRASLLVYPEEDVSEYTEYFLEVVAKRDLADQSAALGAQPTVSAVYVIGVNPSKRAFAFLQSFAVRLLLAAAMVVAGIAAVVWILVRKRTITN